MRNSKQHNILFAFGAGASCDAGAPLMNNFFDRARDLFSAGKLGQDVREDFSKVFKAIDALQLTHSKATLDIFNLESIFTAFEFANFLNTDRNIFNQELIVSLKRLITATIEQSIKYDRSTTYDGLVPTAAYLNFARRIKEYQNLGYRVVIISFNYDIALDFAMLYTGVKINYCLSEQNPPDDSVTYLKLHGSLNWRKCNNCNQILPIKLEDIFQNRRRTFPTGYVSVGLEKMLIPHQECNGMVEEVSFLVPPSWNKQGYYEAISRVWVQAAQEIKNATSIFVCGYSLPQTDQYFQNLYALGSMNSSPLHCFHVYNPDETGDVEGRFKKLLGTGAISRFKYISGKSGSFSVCINDIWRLFQNETARFQCV